MNRWLCLILIALIFFNPVQAQVEIVVLDPETPNPTDNGTISVDAQTNQNYLNLLRRVGSLEIAVNNKVSTVEFETGINFVIEILANQFDEKTNILILGVIMGQLLTLGLGFGIFFYLKGQRKV